MKAKNYLPREGEVQAMPFTNQPQDNADLFDWLNANKVRNYRFSSSFGGGVILTFTGPDGKDHEAEEDMIIVRHEEGKRWTTMRADPFFDRYEETDD